MDRLLLLKEKILRYLALERQWFPTLIKGVWIGVPTMMLLVWFYIYLVQKNPYDLFGGMPSLTAIQNPENDLSSEVISSDGVSLGRYFTHNRSQLTYEQLPPVL